MVQKRNIPQELNVSPKEGGRLGIPVLNKEDFANNASEFEGALMRETLCSHLFNLGAQIVHCDVSCTEVARAIDEIDVPMRSGRTKA
jgi:hypothetical protein